MERYFNDAYCLALIPLPNRTIVTNVDYFVVGGALRFAQQHNRTNVFLNQEFEVGTNLLVKVHLLTPR